MREVAATLSVMALLIVLAVGWPRPSELVAKDARPTVSAISATPTFPGRYVPPRSTLTTDQSNG